MQETLVRFRGWEDPLEKGKATHSSILGLPCGSAGKESTFSEEDLCSIRGLGRYSGEGNSYPSSILTWRIPWTIQSMGLHRVWHNWATFTFNVVKCKHCFFFFFIYVCFLTNPQIVRNYQILSFGSCVFVWVLGRSHWYQDFLDTVCVCVCVCVFLCQLISGKSLTIFPAKFFFAKV